MAELKEAQPLYLPDLSHLEREGLRFFIDGEGPNWLVTGRRGARLLDWLREPLTVGALSRRYAEWLQLDAAKSWLHVHSFVRDCLRTGMLSFTPFERAPYAGRSAHLRVDKLSEVWIHTNNSCNLSCTHCLVSSSPAADPGLPTSRLLHIIDQACECGVERFYFTGGEPFARPDIFELIQTVTEKKQAELIILTNGLLFQGKRLDRLGQISRDRLRLQISLDGAVAETNDRYRGRGTFDRIAEGTRTVAGLGFPVSLTTVVTRENLEELPRIAQFVKDWGAQSQHLMWMHRRGRVLETDQDAFPSCQELIGAARATAQEAGRLGIRLDNLESLKLRVNGRPGVKYDLGNQFWIPCASIPMAPSILRRPPPTTNPWPPEWSTMEIYVGSGRTPRWPDNFGRPLLQTSPGSGTTPSDSYSEAEILSTVISSAPTSPGGGTCMPPTPTMRFIAPWLRTSWLSWRRRSGAV